MSDESITVSTELSQRTMTDTTEGCEIGQNIDTTFSGVRVGDFRVHGIRIVHGLNPNKESNPVVLDVDMGGRGRDVEVKVKDLTGNINRLKSAFISTFGRTPFKDEDDVTELLQAAAEASILTIEEYDGGRVQEGPTKWTVPGGN